MPFEPGGRADKLGNRYEGRWVVKQLLRLVKEEITSITLEAVGDDEEGIDLWLRNKDSSRVGSQCKARNRSKEYWTIGDLGSRGIFEKAKQQLDANENVSYQFVSAVNCMMLNDITYRARNSNDNSEHFYEFQIKGSSEVEKAFRNIVRYFGLDYTSVKDRERVFEYLKRMYVIHYADDLETKRSLKETIKHLFIGNPETIYSLLIDYPIENDLLGKEISPYLLMSFLQSQPEISLRDLHKDERIVPRIDYLNDEFNSTFLKINNSLINREESKKSYKEILNGNSILIHGRAGSGKSGCVVELINRLKQENIAHLALKLDRRVPENSSNNYGSQLELPASPVFCIDAISKDKEAVLILDQLDAIRWTNNHSSTALEVCKEMITEVKNINKDRDKKISLVFVCRTFDFQNDSGIKQLFAGNDKSKQVDTWKEIIMNELDNETVKRVVGETFDNLPSKLKTLLKTPSNLYIWSNLEEDRRYNTYISSSDLIEQWWNQLSFNSEKLGISNNNNLNELKDVLVKQIDKIGKLMIPIQLVGHCSKIAIEHLLSSGLLFSDNKRIGFVHQSFYDYFLVEQMIQQIFNGNSITSILGPVSKQTPSKRYQLQMLLENLLDYDVDDFIDTGHELLQSENIRFYMKYVFLEVLGQAKSINVKVEVFLKEYVESEYWGKHLIDAVFNNHPIFIKMLIEEGYITKWLSSEQEREQALMLLRTVNSMLSREATSLLLPLAFKEPELDNKIYNVLCWDIADDSDEMFGFRIELLKYRPQFLDIYISWNRLAKDAPNRAYQLINMIFKESGRETIGNSQDLDENSMKIFIGIAKENPHQVWEDFMPYIAESTQNTTSIYDPKLKFWKSEQYMEQKFGRTFIEMIKAAGRELIHIDVEELLKRCEKYYDHSSYIVNEILLDVMESLSTEYSDYVMHWLMERPQWRFFNYTGDSEEYLLSAKNIIGRHSKTCSEMVFKKFENMLYYYQEENELELAKSRFDFNREKKNKLIVHWPYWGEVQYYLMPSLDHTRISVKIKELKRILERRFKKRYFNRHKRNLVRSGSVSSTIEKNADKISNKQWLRIIEKKEFGKEKWSLTDGPFFESSPWKFSRDLERIGKMDPDRIAKLAIEFPIDVDSNYVRAIFDVIGEKEVDKDIAENEDWQPVNLYLAQRLYGKWENKDDIEVAFSFCSGIKKRAGESWEKEILDEISNLAKNHPNPEREEFSVVSSNDKEGKTIHSLFTNSMNCVRGCAGRTIATLLWEDSGRLPYLKDAVESIVNDKNLAVNMSAIECIAPIMNIDKEYAKKCFFKLSNKDLKIAAHPYAYNFFYHLYKQNQEAIEELILKMYNSEFDDVAKVGATSSNMNVLYGSFDNIVFSQIKKTKTQKKGIIRIAIDLMGYSDHHNKCKDIISHFLDEGIEEEFSFLYNQLLNKNKLNIEEDIEFILKIVTSKSNRRIVWQFVDFINENDIPIIRFKDIIFGMAQNIIQNYRQEVKDAGNELYGIVSELSRLVALIYDRSQDDFEINQKCLDIWDEMFESQIGTMRELTGAIMDM